MSILDKLGIDKNKRKVDPTLTMNYKQKQEYKKAQQRKQVLQIAERTAKITTPPAKTRPCPICEKPMTVPVGTIMHCHAECKPRFKRAVRRIAKTKSLNEVLDKANKSPTFKKAYDKELSKIK